MISRIPKWIGDWLESATGPLVKVLEIHYITPSIKKITFQGNISKMDFIIGGASVIRVSETEYRNYTVAYHDIEKGTIEVIFHIHGNGVGSTYISTLKTGDELYISIPRGHRAYDPKVKQYVFFGDETTLGLACSLFTVMKQNGDQFQFIFELDNANKNVPNLLGLENHTIFVKDGSFSSEIWLKNLPIFQTPDFKNTNFVLTGNVRSVQALRRVLKNLNTGKILAQGYWLEGKKGL